MNVLRVEIGEAWPATEPVRWALVDVNATRETLLREGHGPLADAPLADSCEFVLSDTQCTLHRLRLPPGNARDQNRLLTYALEEHLAQDAETQHFTLLGKQGEDSLVAVISLPRVQQIIDAASATGHAIHAIWPALALLPARNDAWVLAATAHSALLRLSDSTGYAWDLPAGGETPWMLRQATAQIPRPSRLSLRGNDDSLGEMKTWAAALNLPADTDTPWAFWQIPADARGTANLLHGSFARRAPRGAWLRPLRHAAWIAGAALALHLGASVAHATWLHWQATSLRQQQEALFRSAFPGATVVDPALQTRRLYNGLQSRQGQLRDDDFLTLSHALAEALGVNGKGALRAMQYEDGKLKATLALPAGYSASGLVAALASRGVDARLPEEMANARSNEIQLHLRRSLP